VSEVIVEKPYPVKDHEGKHYSKEKHDHYHNGKGDKKNVILNDKFFELIVHGKHTIL
jgi:hypothetical protein